MAGAHPPVSSWAGVRGRGVQVPHPWQENGGRQVGRSERKTPGHQPSVSPNPCLWHISLFPSHWFSNGSHPPPPPQRHQQPPETSLVVGPRTVLLQSSRQTPVLVAQSCPTLGDPMHCILPSSSVHESLQARILEWVATPFSRESSQPRART